MGLTADGQPKRASADSLVSIASALGVQWADVAQTAFGTTDPTALASAISRAGGIRVGAHWLLPPGLQLQVPEQRPRLTPFRATPRALAAVPSTGPSLVGIGAAALAVWGLVSWLRSGSRENPTEPARYLKGEV